MTDDRLPLERLLRLLRRTLLTVVGAQLALALGMTLVDSYRRRGKRPKPFPVTPPRVPGLEGRIPCTLLRVLSNRGAE